MKKLRTFFYSLYKSATSPKYYQDILKTKFKFSLKYYLMLGLLAAFVSTLVVGIRVLPTFKVEMRSFFDKLLNTIPTDLVITIKDGKWNINKPEPLTIPFQALTMEGGSENFGFENLIVFYRQGTIEDLKTFKTLILVNDTNVIVADPSGKITSNPIEDTKDMEISYSTLEQIKTTILKYAPYFMIATFAIGSVFLYVVSNAIKVFIIGIIVYFFAKANKKKLPLLDSVRIGMHTITIPMILQVIVGGIGFNIPVSNWAMLINLILAVIFTERLFSTLESKDLTELKSQN